MKHGETSRMSDTTPIRLSIQCIAPLMALIVAMMGFTAASPAQLKSKSEAGDKPKPAVNTAGLIGTFKAEGVTITIKEVGGRFQGTVATKGTESTLTGALVGRTIHGTLVSGKIKNPFTATAVGNVLQFTLGARVYQLNRVFTAATFAGTFVGKDDAITIDADESSASGTLKLAKNTYVFTAKLDGQTLKGKYLHRGVENEFSATILGDTLSVNTGIQVVKFTRSQTAPRVEFVNTVRRSKVLAKSKYVIENTILVSPDNNHIAYVDSPEGARRVVLDGKPQPADYSRGGLIFSPDSKHLAYLNARKGKWYFVLNGKESEGYDDFGIGANLFSPDSQRWAYAARIGKYFYIVDNKGKSKPYDAVSSTLFSPNSKRLSFVAKRNGQDLIVIEGNESPIASPIEYGRILFSPDSRRVAYVVAKEVKQQLIVDGQPRGAYESIHGIAFSPDSKRIALIVGENDKRMVIADGVESNAYQAIGDLVFSPDGKQLAFAAKREGTWRMVVDGKEHEPFESVETPVFNPNGNRMAYAVQHNGEMLVIHQNKRSRKHHRITGVTFSPNGSRLAFLVYTRTGRWQVVVDGRASRTYDHKPTGLTFSEDSAHVAFAAKRAGKDYIVINAVEGTPIGELLPGSRPVFDSPNKLHTIVRRGEEYQRVELEILQ